MPIRTDWPMIRTDIDDERPAKPEEVGRCELCGALVLEEALQRHLGERRCAECRTLCPVCHDYPVSQPREFCPICALEAMGVQI